MNISVHAHHSFKNGNFPRLANEQIGTGCRDTSNALIRFPPIDPLPHFHPAVGSKPKTNTVHNIFRRAGLVPHDWAKGWKGAVPFSFRP